MYARHFRIEWRFMHVQLNTVIFIFGSTYCYIYRDCNGLLLLHNRCSSLYVIGALEIIREYVCSCVPSYLWFTDLPLTFVLMQLLVLGGSGFVGSHVCNEALDRGFVVSSLNR
jgi:hypothetical protein